MSKSFLIRPALASLVLLLLASCSMNSIFLHPYPLKRSDTFSQFVEEKNDTLTLKFDERYQATIVDSKNQVQELEYSIESGFMKKSSGDSLNFENYSISRFNCCGRSLWRRFGEGASFIAA